MMIDLESKSVMQIHYAANEVKAKMPARCSFAKVIIITVQLFSSIPSLQLKWIVSASVLVVVTKACIIKSSL